MSCVSIPSSKWVLTGHLSCLVAVCLDNRGQSCFFNGRRGALATTRMPPFGPVTGARGGAAGWALSGAVRGGRWAENGES